MKYYINKKCTEIVICMKKYDEIDELDELENNIPRIIIHFKTEEYWERIRINFDISEPLDLNNLKFLLNKKIESIELFNKNIVVFNENENDFYSIQITPTSIIYGNHEVHESKIIYDIEENKTDE
jgi:hypothetical protein